MQGAAKQPLPGNAIPHPQDDDARGPQHQAKQERDLSEHEHGLERTSDQK